AATSGAAVTRGRSLAREDCLLAAKPAATDLRNSRLLGAIDKFHITSAPTAGNRGAREKYAVATLLNYVTGLRY
ncbi:MAG TPA: hypothetical protein VGK64_27240, partial [Bryobacteraceae bacterium]